MVGLILLVKFSGCVAAIPCYLTPCENGATCMQQENNTEVCVCPPKFTGERCENGKHFQLITHCNRLMIERLWAQMSPPTAML